MVKLWKHWCRLCGASADTNCSYINVFLKDEQKSPLSDTINKFFSVNITREDDWPQIICTRCHQIVTSIISLSHRASRVQAMFAKLCDENAEEIDPEEVKLYYELDELDDFDIVLKLFAKSSPALSREIEVNPSLPADEPQYNGEMLVDPSEIKIENVNEDDSEMCDEEWQPLLSDGDECSSPSQESDSNRFLVKKEECQRLRAKETTELKCLECNKVYKRFTSYRHHMQAAHGATVNPTQFPCKECDKAFATAWRLKEHQSTHLDLEQEPDIPCPHCNEIFSEQTAVQAHIRAIHLDGKVFICEECGKTYQTLGALKEHKVSHTDVFFKCSSCDKSFKSKASLKRHEDTHKDTKYICPTCGLQLNTQRTLRMHMLVHSDQRRHKCDYCGNEYKRAKALKNHLILHTGLKPYTCNFCDKTFANGANCRSHKKKTHPAELAAMEAAGTKIVAANIPKLEDLRVATSKRADSLADESVSKRQSRTTSAVFS